MTKKLFFILIFLSGCSRVNRFLNKQFFESCRPCDYIKGAHDSIRTIKLYDQFSTVGIFTALWINEKVTEAYQKAYNQQRNLPLDSPVDIPIDLNNNQQKFYIIGYQPKIEGSVFDVCDDNNSSWHLSIEFNNKYFKPVSIKPVKADRILEAILRPYHNRFNELYEVTFNLDLTNYQNYELKMNFSSLDAIGTVLWIVKNNTLLMPDCAPLRICRECADIC